MTRAWEEAKRWEEKYYAERQRIVDLAREHLPEVRYINEDSLPGFGKAYAVFDQQPEMVCKAKGCSEFWPCSTYLWATGSKDFTVRIEKEEDEA